jgi:large subunit ribosomal protein L11
MVSTSWLFARITTRVPVDAWERSFTIFADSSFKFVLKSSPTAVLLRKAAGVEKGSAQPNREIVGKVTRAQVREIAQIKLNDTNAVDMDGAVKQVEGTAHNMGITIVD